jgi:hypothetical protein
VLLPFYICDAVLQPLAATRTPIDFYPLTEGFLPSGAPEPAAGELMLVVNYFGVLSPYVEARSRAGAGRVVVDDTQAFFRRGRPTRGRSIPSASSSASLTAASSTARLRTSTACRWLIANRSAYLLARLAGDDDSAWPDSGSTKPASHRPRAAAVRRPARRPVSRCAPAPRIPSTLPRLPGPLNKTAGAAADAAGDGPMAICFPPAARSPPALTRLGIFVLRSTRPGVARRGSRELPQVEGFR